MNMSSGPFPWKIVPVELDGDTGTFTIHAEDIVITPPDIARDRSSATDDHAFSTTYGMTNHTEMPMLRYKNCLSAPFLRELALNPL
jgi:hypothetical protein